MFKRNKFGRECFGSTVLGRGAFGGGGLLSKVQALGNLKYFKDFTTGETLLADYAAGTSDITITASRSASNPATVVQTQDETVLSFDGVDDVVTLASDPIESTSSISFKFKIKVFSAKDLISGQGAGGDRGWGVFLSGTDEIGFFTSDNGTNVGSIISTNANLATSTDYWVTITYTGSTVNFYLDGVLLTNDAGTVYASTTTSAGGVTIGARNLPSEFSNVEFKDIQFHDKVLSESEIATVHGGGNVTDSMAHHWDFSDGSGSTLTDQVGSNNGTISGAQWLVAGENYLKTITASNTARYQSGYYDSTGFNVAPGLLVEGAATNLLTYSDQFDHADWNKDTGIAANATNIVAPDGSASADEFVYAASGNTFRYHQNVTVTASVPYVFSIWAKTDSGTLVMGLRDGATDTENTHTITTEWRRFFLKFTPGSTIATVGVEQRAVITPGVSETGTFHVWGAQLEQSAFPSSYIPTTTAALTRNQESPTIVANDGNFHNHLKAGNTALSFVTNDQVEENAQLAADYPFSIMVKFRKDNAAAAFDNLFFLGDKDASGVMYGIGFVATTGEIFAYARNTVEKTAVSVDSYTDGDEHIAVAVFESATSRKIFVDSASGVENTDSVSFNSAVDRWSLGRRGDITADQYLDGEIFEARFYNTALSDSDASDLAQGEDITSGLVNKWDATSLTSGASTLTDSVGSNDGTISGATVVGVEHAGTIVMAYRPVMLPDEQASEYGSLIRTYIDANNLWQIRNRTNAFPRPVGHTVSGGTQDESGAGTVSWDRYSLNSSIFSFSTTADGSGNKGNMYVNGSLTGSNVDYLIPIGDLPATIELQATSGQAMMLEAIAIYSNSLTAAQVSTLHGLIGV